MHRLKMFIFGRMKRFGFTLSLLLVCLGAAAQTLQQGRNYFAQGDYERAKPIMLKYLKQSPENASRNYWYGVCCIETGEPDIAVPYLEKAAEKKIFKAYRYLGHYYEGREDYQQAISAFESYVEGISQDKELHDPEIESRYTEITDSLKVLFRMIRSTNRVCFIDSITVKKEDVFDSFILGESVGSIINSADFFGDGSEGEVFMPEMENQIIYSRRNNEGLFSLFTRYKSFDQWDEEIPLDGLESDGDIRYPFIMNDGVTIYYASNSSESIGGLDLFVSRFNSQTGRFLKPEQLGMPFNSEANDYLYIIDETNNLGWFVTDRRQPEGYVCIYIFIPNDSYQVYNYENGDTLAIHRAARLLSVAETQTNLNDVREARQRLTILAYDISESKEKGSFRFIIDDVTEYHELSDFKNSNAMQLFSRWEELKSVYKSYAEKLQSQRDAYSQAARKEKEEMTEALLQLEEEVLKMEQQVITMENEIRTLEINYLKR